jgi:hypothetical protein
VLEGVRDERSLLGALRKEQTDRLLFSLVYSVSHLHLDHSRFRFPCATGSSITKLVLTLYRAPPCFLRPFEQFEAWPRSTLSLLSSLSLLPFTSISTTSLLSPSHSWNSLTVRLSSPRFHSQRFPHFPSPPPSTNNLPLDNPDNPSSLSPVSSQCRADDMLRPSPSLISSRDSLDRAFLLHCTTSSSSRLLPRTASP